MPIYEYRCVSCGREIEVIHGISAEGPSTCDVCGAPMRKLLSAPAILFRGGGWAKKDARESQTSRSADGAAPGAEKSTTEAEKAAGAEKGPAGEGTSKRDKPAEAASGEGEKGAPGGVKSSRSSDSDD